MDRLIEFLKSQKLMAIASRDVKDIWVANVYIGTDNKGAIYFMSPENTKHSQMILKNPEVAFSIAWFDDKNHNNRKGVQGLGVCRIAGKKEMAVGIKELYKNFPDMRNILNIKWVITNVFGSKIWVLKPSYIKYWDDELYGDDECAEFNF